MKTLKSQRVISVPEGVTVAIKSRTVTVKGPRGELTRSPVMLLQRTFLDWTP